MRRGIKTPTAESLEPLVLFESDLAAVPEYTSPFDMTFNGKVFHPIRWDGKFNNWKQNLLVHQRNGNTLQKLAKLMPKRNAKIWMRVWHIDIMLKRARHRKSNPISNRKR